MAEITRFAAGWSVKESGGFRTEANSELAYLKESDGWDEAKVQILRDLMDDRSAYDEGYEEGYQCGKEEADDCDGTCGAYEDGYAEGVKKGREEGRREIADKIAGVLP